MLVDAFETFRVLNRHKKFPPEFVVGCIWRQIEPIETEI